MLFHLDPASEEPNYLQLEHQIKTACLHGKLKPGDQLPSIRVLAKDLSIAIITVKRAYDDLQSEGIIELRQGKGCFIKKVQTSSLQKQNMLLIHKKLNELIHYAKEIGCTNQEIESLLEQFLMNIKEENHEQ
ncbi:MAG: GntR family transcriptional regulator [Erysipelotrichaceae bacterium]|nr:GntR family transcriptional regulator [Erysipelotrichaceae bacterium]